MDATLEAAVSVGKLIHLCSPLGDKGVCEYSLDFSFLFKFFIDVNEMRNTCFNLLLGKSAAATKAGGKASSSRATNKHRPLLPLHALGAEQENEYGMTKYMIQTVQFQDFS